MKRILSLALSLVLAICMVLPLLPAAQAEGLGNKELYEKLKAINPTKIAEILRDAGADLDDKFVTVAGVITARRNKNTKSGDMMALIDNNHAIFRNEGFHGLIFALEKRLHNSNIHNAVTGIFPSSNLADEM